MAGYDRATDPYECALVRVSLNYERFGAAKHSIMAQERQPDGTYTSRRVPVTDTAWTGHSNPGLVAQTREIMHRYGTRWLYEQRVGTAVLLPVDHPKVKAMKPAFGLCSILMARDEGRWTSFSYCNRLVVADGDDCCPMHAKVHARAEAREQAFRAKMDATVDQWRRDGAMGDEMTELWQAVCEHYSIDRPGPVEVRNGRATVDGEILARFLRMLLDG